MRKIYRSYISILKFDFMFKFKENHLGDTRKYLSSVHIHYLMEWFLPNRSCNRDVCWGGHLVLMTPTDVSLLDILLVVWGGGQVKRGRSSGGRERWGVGTNENRVRDEGEEGSGVDWLFSVTFNDISVKHVMAHSCRCAGLLKKVGPTVVAIDIW